MLVHAKQWQRQVNPQTQPPRGVVESVFAVLKGSLQRPENRRGPSDGSRNLRVTPHVAQNHERRGGSAIDGRTTRHPGYAVSQKKRKRIEECFGWLKTIALMRKVRHRGVCRVHWIFTLACAAYNLLRMRNLTAAVPAA